LEDQAALEAGMQEKAQEFKRSGGKIYQDVDSTEPVTMRAAPKY
jgi:hypothetical protein